MVSTFSAFVSRSIPGIVYAVGLGMDTCLVFAPLPGALGPFDSTNASINLLQKVGLDRGCSCLVMEVALTENYS